MSTVSKKHQNHVYVVFECPLKKASNFKALLNHSLYFDEYVQKTYKHYISSDWCKVDDFGYLANQETFLL